MFEPPDSAEDLACQVEEIDRLTLAVAANDPQPDEWSGATFAVAGEAVQVKRPNARSLHAFTAAISRHSPSGMQNDMVSLFIRSHTSPDSFERLMYRMMESEITMADLGQLMRDIATWGTARPTGPSRI